MRGLAGRVALVTGAGGPMGLAVARRLAGEGMRLVLTDISGSRLEASRQSLAAEFGADACVAQRADVLQRAEALAVVEAGQQAYGAIDVLVNVVGGIRSSQLYTPFLQLSEAQWDSTLALNLKPGFHLIQALAPGMLARGWGRIVNFASIALQGEGGQADYAAAKAAVAAFTRSLAEEFAPQVRVNCVAPGLIQTTVTDRLDPAEREELTQRGFIQRAGQPGEVADAVAFLVSDESSFITGEVLAVSGGNHPHL